MPITLNDGLKVNAPRASDMRYGKITSGKTAPYASVAEALALVPIPYRYVGLTINISNEEWWWKTGVNDGDLVIKSSAPDGLIVIFKVTASDVGEVEKLIPALAGKQFTMRRDLATMVKDVDYLIYPGGGFSMINAGDEFLLDQVFELTVTQNIIVI